MSMSAVHHYPSDAVEAAGGVTEIVLSGDPQAALQRVLPMIAHLSESHDPRWLTWITTGIINRDILLAAGVNPERVRLIHLHRQEDICWVLWDAMACGTSHTVIATPGVLPDKTIDELDGAGAKGHCQGLLLRLRQPL